MVMNKTKTMAYTKADRIKFSKDKLIARNLTAEEADQFMVLLEKITPTEADYRDFDFTMGDAIPFEGGMCFTEGLTGMKISLNR